MNQLLQSNALQELHCEGNLSYVLDDSSLFQTTEFKVLCHQRNSVFVDSSKMILNGKIQIYYFTGKYISLGEAVRSFQIEDLLRITTELYSSLLEIKKIGFLSLRNVLTDKEHIFVDTNTKKVKWIYLPISNGFTKNEIVSEQEVLKELKQAIKPLLSEKEAEKYEELINEDISLEQIVSRIKNSAVIQSNKKLPADAKLRLIIQSTDKDNPLSLIDDKDEYLLGRKASAVDGLINGSNLVGRVHCKIIRNGYSFSVIDLQSRNGTFVNEERVRPNIMASLSNGDRLRLANVEFLIIVEEKNSAKAQNTTG